MQNPEILPCLLKTNGEKTAQGQKDNQPKPKYTNNCALYLLGRTNGHLYISHIYKYLQYTIVGGFTPYLPILIDMVQFN